MSSQGSQGKASTAFLAIGELEHRFDPPLEVGTNPLNLTENVDMASWFRASDGTMIDPSTANLGGPNALKIAINISHSLHAFRDDDHDGHDDHGEVGEHH
jgi:hypothetical protein